MKTLLVKYLKLWILVAVTGLSFLFSAATSSDEELNPCYSVGTRAWDGYLCLCNEGFKGKCCEIDMETGMELVGCNFPEEFKFKMVYITCKMEVDGDVDLEASLGKIFKVTGRGDGHFTIELENYAYECQKGRELVVCESKSCSTALKEVMS